MNKLLHKIAHLLNWNYGKPDSFYDNDKLMMSFLCSGCGERSDIHCVDNLVDSMIEKDLRKINPELAEKYKKIIRK